MPSDEPVQERGDSLPADSVVTLLRELIEYVSSRGKVEIGRAQERGRHQLELRQLRKDRSKRLEKLGREVIALHRAGELDHPGLLAHMDHIHALDKRIAEAADPRADRGDFGEE